MSAVGRCPVLGLKEDEHTNLSYASNFHVCYRAGKPQALTLEHQNNYCLGKTHTRCPIFLYGASGNKVDKKPPVAKKAVNNLSTINQNKKIGTRTYWDVLGFILFAIIFFVGWWAYVNRDQIMRPDSPVQASVYLETQQILTPDPTEIFLADPNLVRELTANPLPANGGGSETNLFNITITPEPTNLDSLTATVTETPNPNEIECELPGGWISYVVQSGDTLFSLAETLNVEIDQLRLLNCLDSDTLTAGQALFLPYYPVITLATSSRTPTFTATIRYYYTATRTPTFTPTPTRIPATKTSIPSPTNTIIPTSTPSSFPTNTAIPTPTPTEPIIPTPIPTLTNTPNPTATYTHIPPPTDTPYPTATSTNWPTIGVTPVQ